MDARIPGRRGWWPAPWLALAAVLTCAGAVAPAGAQPPNAGAAKGARLAVVDVQRVLLRSAAGRAARQRLAREKAAMERELAERRKAIVADREDLTSRWRTLDPAERREEEAELERLQVEARRAAQDLRSDLAKTEQRLLGGMLRAIVRIAGKVGEQEGYDLVVDRRQATVLFAADSADLTDEVIAAYDAEVKETERGR